MNELNVRAVVVGSLVDTIGTLIVGLLLEGAVAVSTGVTSGEELTAVFDASVSLQIVQLALGLAMTAIGAFVAAWLARGTERLHAFAVGVVSTLIGFVFVFSAPEASPFWAQAAGLILTIPAAYLGGEARLRTAARQPP